MAMSTAPLEQGSTAQIDESASAPSFWSGRNIGFAIANVLFIFQGLVAYVGIMLGLLPSTPTDDVAFFCVALAYHGPFFAFLDRKGEKRTTIEKFRLYIKWWSMTAITAVVFWELPWYILEKYILRLNVPLNVYHKGMEHLWIFWSYGIADHRFLNGDVTVLSIECMSICTGLTLIPAFFAMQKDKIWGYWVGALGMSGVAYVTTVYVISDWYVGWANVSPRAYDFWVKFLFTQTPYMFYGGFAAFCCLKVANHLAVKKAMAEQAPSPAE